MTAAQWNRIASMLPVLEGLQIATTAMSSEQNVSASCILPVVNGLKNNFLKIIPTDGTLLKSFQQTVSTEMSKRFNMGLDADSISAVAACLDPRHKSLKFLNETLRLRIHEHIRSLVDDVEERSKINTDIEAETPPNISAMALLLGEDYFDEQQSLRDEFTSYIEERPLPSNSDPLQW